MFEKIKNQLISYSHEYHEYSAFNRKTLFNVSIDNICEFEVTFDCNEFYIKLLEVKNEELYKKHLTEIKSFDKEIAETYVKVFDA